MQIKQDPVTKLWCREDGAVLMPLTRRSRFKKFRWTFGSKQLSGYRTIKFHGKIYRVHRIACRAFHGPAPEGKSFVDHIDRCKTNNSVSNLHWVSVKENQDNQASVDKSIEKYGVRACDGRKAYDAAYAAAHREERKAYTKNYHERHREERKAYEAAYRAKMKARGLRYRKGPDGRFGWYPRIRS